MAAAVRLVVIMSAVVVAVTITIAVSETILYLMFRKYG